MARNQQWEASMGRKPGGLPGGRAQALAVKMGGVGQEVWSAVGTAQAEPGKGQSVAKPRAAGVATCLAPI